MADAGRLPAGTFSTWFEALRAALVRGADVDVPCGDCVACCTSSYFIHVSPDESAALAAIPAALLFPAPGRPDGTLLLGYDSHGRCPMLHDGRCSIYEQRPRTCRIYDCRVFAAAGLDADRPAITARARRWEFDEASGDDRTRRAAVAAAARFLTQHTALFPPGSIPDSPADLAVLAIRVSDLFLERNEGTGAVALASPAVDDVVAVLETIA